MKVGIKILMSIILIISFSAYSSDINEAKVCFYSLDNFTGESFCSYQGESHPVINSPFNNLIKSISIPPGMIIEVYEGANFSGKKKKLKNDITLQGLNSFDLYKKIRSYKIEPAVCFYTEDEFQGNSTCLATNQQIDLYTDGQGYINSNRNVLPIRNDSIQSINIPPEMMSTVFKNDHFNEPFFTLTESIDSKGLKSLGMDNQLTSLQVSENKGLACNQKCVILENHTIKLSEAFGEYWNDTRLINKQIILSFDNKEMDEKESYGIIMPHGVNILIAKHDIIFSNQDMNHNFYFDRRFNLDKLSFIIQIKDNNTIQTQYIQTLNNQMTDMSPILEFKWQPEADETPILIITNDNINNPLVLHKAILTADTGNQYLHKRDLAKTSQMICIFTPFLNIYNYLTQNTCHQLDNIVFNVKEFFDGDNHGKTLHISGKSFPLKQQSPPVKEIKIDNNYMTLTHVYNTTNNQSLSLPAAAKACMTSLHLLFNPRPTRQPRPPCIDWTLEIMTDFTLLFGGSVHTWNTESFGNIIHSIVTTGHTGIAVENTEVEKRLIDSVKKIVISQSMHNSLNHLKSAFDYAQLTYLDYSLFYASTDTPSQVEHLPLGIYELLLSSFINRTIPPTIIEGGQAVEHSELAFEIEVLPTFDPEEQKVSEAEIQHGRALRQIIRRTIIQWAEQYQGSHVNHYENSDPEQHGTLRQILHAGNIVTGIIYRRLMINRPGEIYVIVKLKGDIIAIVLADRFNNRDDVELVASVTRPEYVLSPNNEGTVRGAGTAAIYELAQYLQQQGARTLFSEVISQPSARVKQKVGFTFKSEF